MKFKLPDGTTAISIGGREYGARAGIADLPERYAAELAWHGCQVAEGAGVGVKTAAPVASPRQRRTKE